MKKLLLLTLLALTSTSQALDKPGIDVVRAAKVASEYLASQGNSGLFIASIAVDEGAILSGKATWVVKWSKTVTTSDGTEVGVRIKDDGSVVRLIEGKGSRSKRRPAALDIR